MVAVALARQFQAARYQNDDDLTRDPGASAAAVSSDPSAEATSVGLVGKSATDAEFCPKECVSIVGSDDLAGLKFAARRVGEGHFLQSVVANVGTLQDLSVRWEV
jgi:hypothetical protein